jgi:hypothetical protein
VNVEAMQPLTENSHCAGAPCPTRLKWSKAGFAKKT